MPDPTDVIKNLASSKDQLAQISQIGRRHQEWRIASLRCVQNPRSGFRAVQGALGGLEGTSQLDAAKGAMDNATKAAAALKDEAMQKMPAPVGAAKDALTGLGQQVGAAGAPIPDIAGSLPAMSAPNCRRVG